MSQEVWPPLAELPELQPTLVTLVHVLSGSVVGVPWMRLQAVRAGGGIPITAEVGV